ncbi:Hypothetical predicted protein [Olea europaea subsp. europaea]|uniref:Uncharacterized protein n=1 Tax=Olea europaea subsp. europaea TaxID=158383 RepID=A0A8S0TNI5_OLEEU|nr:Hypothetical predicted protein [Olea europaea subsp. europaea]
MARARRPGWNMLRPDCNAAAAAVLEGQAPENQLPDRCTTTTLLAASSIR